MYGADKVWRQLVREGVAVARCTVEPLMRRLGLQGMRRGKGVRTTVLDAKAACPLDRVNRQFRAGRSRGTPLAPASRGCGNNEGCRTGSAAGGFNHEYMTQPGGPPAAPAGGW